MLRIDGKTKIVGVFGWPVGHSLSPAMHNAAFSHTGLNYIYLPFKVEPSNLSEAIAGLIPLGIGGVNLTIPHKREAVKYLDEVMDEAALTRSVNTIVVREGKLIGCSTDGEGFITSLSEDLHFSARGKKVVILGAGGAGSAIAFALAREKVSKLVIANRTPERGGRLVNEIKQNFPEVQTRAIRFSKGETSDEVRGCELLVNATPLGMNADAPGAIIEQGCLGAGHAVFDIVYSPPLTPLLSLARQAGARWVNGLGMLIYQGAASFKLWTGAEPPIEVMREAAKKHEVDF